MTKYEQMELNRIRRNKKESKFESILKDFEITKNNGKSRTDLLDMMKERIEIFPDIAEISEELDDDQIDELLIKICTFFNVQIICYVTGLRIKSFREDKKFGKMPKFTAFNTKILDTIKSSNEIGQLADIAHKVETLGSTIGTVLTADEQIFKKSEWFNLQTIGRITKDKALLLTCTIISAESIGDLKDVRADAWKEFIIGAGILFLAMLVGGCCIAYNYNDNFKRNVDDFFNYYSDSFSDADVQNIVGE